MGTTPWGDNGVVAVHDFFHSGRVLRAHGDLCRMAGRSVVEWSHADKSGSGLPWKQQEMAVGLSAGFFFFFFLSCAAYIFVHESFARALCLSFRHARMEVHASPRSSPGPGRYFISRL